MLTEAQRQLRQSGIGGSDMPIIMGVSSYKTPFQLYLEKTGPLPENETTEAQFWGHEMEPVIRKHFARKYNVDIETPDTIKHPEIDFLLANIDGYIPSLNAILEVKTSRASSAWADRDNNPMVMQYLIQVAHYCIVTNASCAYIAILIGGNEYHEIKYERNNILETEIIKRAKEFWHCVQTKTPPAPTNQLDLRLMFPKHHPDKIKKIDPFLNQKISSFTDTRSKIKQLNELEDKYKFDIMQFMGDAECLVDDEGKPIISWKANKKGSRMFLVKGA